MTLDQFNKLSEEDKKAFLEHSPKLVEKLDGFTWRQLYSVGNFFVEMRNSLLTRYKKRFVTYTLSNLPFIYRDEL